MVVVHDQADQTRRRKPARMTVRRKTARAEFRSEARPSSKEIIDILTRAGVFDMALANIRRKYRIGG